MQTELISYYVKTVFLVAGLLLATGSLCAQSTMPVCGGSDTNVQTGSMSYTIGQVDYLFSQSANGSAVAGVQQPFDENTAYHTSCDGVELTVYPNPTSENVYVVCDALDASYSYMVTDMTGKLFLVGRLEGEIYHHPDDSPCQWCVFAQNRVWRWKGRLFYFQDNQELKRFGGEICSGDMLMCPVNRNRFRR